MVQRVATVAFEGIEARAVDVQVQIAPGLPAFNVVGLPDKAVSEARDGEGGQAGRDLNLDVDGAGLDALKRDCGDALNHAAPACSG